MTMRKKIWLLTIVCLVAAISLAIALLQPFDGHIPSFAETQSGYRPSEAWLLDRHGEVIAVKRIDHKVRRLEWLDLDNISPAAQELLIQSEDRRFYQHGGVDWLALSASKRG